MLDRVARLPGAPCLLSRAEQNDSHSEEINVIDDSQAENRPVFVQEAELRWKVVSLVGRYVCCA